MDNTNHNFYVGQLVVKVRHPTWLMDGQTSLVPIGTLGKITNADAHYDDSHRGVGVDFPSFKSNGPVVCQHGTLEPVVDHGRHVIGWDQCIWKPKKEFLDQFEL